MKHPNANEKALAYGGVVVDPEGKVLLRKPSGEFDGYVWTFAKGRPKPGQTPQEAALCEVLEETGWECEVVEPIPGTFAGGTTSTAYFLMKPVRYIGSFDGETETILWTDCGTAEVLIGQTQNAVGRKRDLAVLASAMAMVRNSRISR